MSDSLVCILTTTVCALTVGALAGWWLGAVLTALLYSESSAPPLPLPPPQGWGEVGPSDCDLAPPYTIETRYRAESGTWFANIVRYDGRTVYTTAALDRTREEALAYAEFLIQSRGNVLDTLPAEVIPIR